MSFFKPTVMYLVLALTLSACSQQKADEPAPAPDSRSSTLAKPAYSPENQVHDVTTSASAPANAPKVEEGAAEEAMKGQELVTEEQSMLSQERAAPPATPSAPSIMAGQLPPETTNNQQTLTSTMFSKDILARKFVFNAGMRFRVKDVYQCAIEIENMVYATGGFVLKNDIRSDIINTQNSPQPDNTLLQISRYQRSGELVVRVPTHKTQEFLRKLSSQIDYLDVREFMARDVQFDALRQQLAYQRTQETQKTLGQAINQVRSDTKIDAIYGQARMKNIRDDAQVNQAIFEDQVAYSTIRLSIYQPEQLSQDKIVDVDAILKANEPSFFSRLGTALKIGWYGLLNGIIVLAVAWWFWLALLVSSVLVWKKRKKITHALNKQDNKQSAQVVSPERSGQELSDDKKQKPDNTD